MADKNLTATAGLTGAAKGAVSGAAVGSIVGPVGTAVGAGVGALVGAITATSAEKRRQELEAEQKQLTERAAREDAAARREASAYTQKAARRGEMAGGYDSELINAVGTGGQFDAWHQRTF